MQILYTIVPQYTETWIIQEWEFSFLVATKTLVLQQLDGGNLHYATDKQLKGFTPNIALFYWYSSPPNQVDQAFLKALYLLED